MTLRVAVQMDPLESIKIAGDSSFALIEAAQKGIPLLVRDLPVFREVAGSAADYFANTTDPAAIVAAMEKWLAERGKPAAGPSAQLTWLTWDESTVQLFERITQ